MKKILRKCFKIISYIFNHGMFATFLGVFLALFLQEYIKNNMAEKKFKIKLNSMIMENLDNLNASYVFYITTLNTEKKKNYATIIFHLNAVNNFLNDELAYDLLQPSDIYVLNHYIQAIGQQKLLLQIINNDPEFLSRNPSVSKELSRYTLACSIQAHETFKEDFKTILSSWKGSVEKIKHIKSQRKNIKEEILNNNFKRIKNVVEANKHYITQ